MIRLDLAEMARGPIEGLRRLAAYLGIETRDLEASCSERDRLIRSISRAEAKLHKHERRYKKRRMR